MKKFINKLTFILFACIFGLSGCIEEYKDEHETLKLDYTRFNLDSKGGEFAFMVYFDGDWTIELDKEVSWAKLEMTSGTGITPVHLTFEENFMFQRTFKMTISGGGESKTIAVTQKPYVDNPIFRFVEEAIELTNGNYRVKTKMKSNLELKAIQSQAPVVEYDHGENWIGNFAVESISDDYEIDDETKTAVYSYYVYFDITANESGDSRGAHIRYTLFDEEGTEYGCTVPVMQSMDMGTLTIKESTVRGCRRKEYSEAVGGGLERFEEEIECNVTYSGSETDFIENVSLKDRRLYFTLAENTGAAPREADITLSFGEDISATIRVTQREAGINAIYEIFNASDLLEWNKDGANWAADDLVMLMDNIDCAGIITSDNWKMQTFTGTFDGNYKTIDNFVFTKAGPAAFFNGLTGNSLVKNLTFGYGCSVTTTGLASNKANVAMLVTLAKDNASVENVVNYGSVTATEAAKGATSGYYIAGIASQNTSTGTFYGCKNYGTISSSAPGGSTWITIGGILGEHGGTTTATMEACENHGAIIFNATEIGTGSNLNLGGIVGGANMPNFINCKNLGTVTCEAVTTKGTKGINIGGIVGMNNKCTIAGFSGCVNGEEGSTTKGALLNKAESTGEIRIGGCIGYINVNTTAGQEVNTNISGFTNYGPITNNGKTTSWTGLGGIVGYINGIKSYVNSVSECTNYGTISNTVSGGRGGIGGCVGFIKNSATVVSGLENRGNVINTGNSASGSGVALGGIVGRIEAFENGTNSISDCDNYGNVLFDANSADDASMISGIGGIIGVQSGPLYTSSKDDKKYHKSSTIIVEDCSNSGEVKKTKTGSNNFHTGGIVGSFNSTLESGQTYTHSGNITGCTNSGPVHNASSGSGGWWIYTGGIIGYQRCKGGEITGCTNSGNVTNSAASTAGAGGIRLGGIAGGADNGTITDCTNSGKVLDDSAATNTELGGIAGRFTPSSKTVVTGCSNAGEVAYSGTGTGIVSMGGVVGRAQAPSEYSNCSCAAGSKITNGNANAATEYAGGIIGYGNGKTAKFTDCTSVPVMSVQKQTNSGILAGNIAAGSSATGTKVGGSFNGTALTSTNFTSYYFGSSSAYKTTSGISLNE